MMKKLLLSCILSGALAPGVFAAHLSLSPSVPSVTADGESFARILVAAAADQPTLGDLLITLTVKGGGTLNPSQIVLSFGSADPAGGAAQSSYQASDYIYYTASNSTGIVEITASAAGFAPALTVIQAVIKDADYDGVQDDADICPQNYDPMQYDADEDAIGDACDPSTDVDKDHVEDPKDNCPALFNPDQADSDRDGYGDACDNYPRNKRRD